MKTVVSVNEVAELEIKPRVELEQWKQLVKNEIETRLANKDKMNEVSCPVCNSESHNTAFEKSGFHYVECKKCKTIYAQNRPVNEELYAWYTNAESVNFWQNKLLKLSAYSRKIKIIEPRAHWILDGISEYFTNSSKQIKLTDISFFGGSLMETIQELSENITITSSGILADKEEYNSTQIKVDPLSKTIFDFSKLTPTDVLVAIDVLDRIQNINTFFNDLEDIINPGGIFFATCPVSSGFEIQSLWDKSPSIIPPDKLNLPSVQGLIGLFQDSSSWEILELSTPGMFDVESVKQEILRDPSVIWPRNLHALLDNINNQGVSLFTEYLQSQRLSSFARLVLRRKSGKIY